MLKFLLNEFNKKSPLLIKEIALLMLIILFQLNIGIAADKSAEKAADKSAEKAADKSAEKAADKSAEKAADKSAEKTTVSPEQKMTTKSRFEYLELFNKVLYMVEHQYYREIDIEKLIYGSLKGMIETLDPHSAFLDKEVYSKMQDDTSGEFGGIGVEVTQKDGIIYVVTPIDDTPAYKAGIKSGDKIVEIDHESTLGLGLDDAVKKMKGAIGKKVNLGILRERSQGIKHYEIAREKIKVTPVKFELLDDSIGYIRLTQFQKNSADSIKKALKKLKEECREKQGDKQGGKLEAILLDLRSNPGGLLDEAVDVSSIFLKEGIVVSIESRSSDKKDIRYVTKSGSNESEENNYHKDLTTPLALLINGSSASASEIVAGALQDHGRAIIMGQQSFGKGSVQSVSQIDENNGIKLTIAQYLTPKERRIQALGITPDIELDEFSGDWSKELYRPRFIRENDLRNHLNSTIETEDEKNLRLKREKEERLIRSKEFEEKRKSKEKDSKNNSKSSLENNDEDEDEIPFKKYNPKQDFLVVQAKNYIKSYVTISKKQSALNLKSPTEKIQDPEKSDKKSDVK